VGERWARSGRPCRRKQDAQVTRGAVDASSSSLFKWDGTFRGISCNLERYSSHTYCIVYNLRRVLNVKYRVITRVSLAKELKLQGGLTN